MTRTKFTIVGTHPLLFELRRHLIVDELMELVSWCDEPDFVILGATKPDLSLDKALGGLVIELGNIKTGTPVLVLSSSCMYSDRDDVGKVSDNKPMSEDRSTVISSIVDLYAPSTLYTAVVENLVLNQHHHSLILRTFNVYGPQLTNTITSLINSAKLGGEVYIEAPGYQVRTFLHISDFVSAFDKLLPKFLKGARGIYNIGSQEEISLKRLADSVWQLTNPLSSDTPIKLTQPRGRQIWWIIPDVTRIQALLNWKPKVTIRRGLWTMIKEEQHGFNE